MKLRRILHADLAELRCRGAQELAKRMDRLRGAGHRADGLARPVDRAGLEAGRFFEGPSDDNVTRLIATRMPEAGAAIIAEADAVRHGRFDLLGYGGLDFGDPVDWHLDPILGVRSPIMHWSRLDPLDVATVGDSKVVWELSRHQWAVRLAQAYRLTKDAAYARAFADYLDGWLEANPPGMGLNWASSLEAAFRLIAWIWALAVFGDRLSGALVQRLVSEIARHANHVSRYLSYYFSPNTHLTGEALGLFYAGVTLRVAGADRWRETGMRILLAELGRQVFEDGTYFEQSTCYQRYTIEFYLHFMLLARRGGIDLPDGVADRVQRMLDFALALRQPDGVVPSIGDNDGGMLVPLARRGPGDFRGVFALGAVVFQRGDYAWAAGAAAPEILWLLGERGLRSFDALPPTPPADSPRVFPDGGWVVMRSGWDARAHHLIFDVGPLGCTVSGGHGHADLLSIQCAAFGETFLVDPGTYCYTRHARWRDHFRGTSAHNTLTIDGRGQAAPAGPFRWGQRPRARLRQWYSSDGVEFADAEHDAYTLAGGLRHRRRVIFVDGRYWLVIDDVEGSGRHRADLRFQFAPHSVAAAGPCAVRAVSARGAGVVLHSEATSTLRGELLDGWVAPDYGQRVRAPLFVLTTETDLPLRIVTVLLPFEVDRSPAAAVAIVDLPTTGRLVVRVGNDLVQLLDDGPARIAPADAEAL